jgi:hypothetical protein
VPFVRGEMVRVTNREISIGRCAACGNPLLVIWNREICCYVGCPRHGLGADDESVEQLTIDHRNPTAEPAREDEK